jgi:glucosamine-phosphate N-acetyltransferase
MDGLEIRSLIAPDFAKGFAETLSVLSPVNLDHEGLIKVFQRRLKSGVHTYVALHEDQIIGTISVIIEPKFIRNGGYVAHIEDVAVRVNCQLKGVGRALMEHAEKVSKDAGCYKIILDCNESNVGFYEKLGYRRHEVEMRKDIDLNHGI